MSLFSYIKVGTTWDYPLEKINENTSDEIKKIVSYRECALKKVKDGKWTEDEYKSFSKVIRKANLGRIIYFNNIIETLLNMDEEDIKCELDNLSNKEFYPIDSLYDSIPHMLANTIVLIDSKLLYMSGLAITEEEINEKDSIEFHEALLNDLDNDTSDYSILFKEVYNEYVNNTFVNEELKEVLLNYYDTVKALKRKKIFSKIRLLYEDKVKKSSIRVYEVVSKRKTLDRRAKKKYEL